MTALFLDYDNTLNASDEVFAARMDGLFGRSGRVLMDRYMHIHRHIVHKEHPDKHEDVSFHIHLLLGDLGMPDTTANFRLARGRFRQAQRACFAAQSLYVDAVEFLKRLDGLPLRIYLTTGDHAKEKAAGLARATGRDLFLDVFDGARLGTLKGSRGDYYRCVLDITGVRADEAVVIGDSPVIDIAPAKALGLRAWWVNRSGAAFPLQNVVPDLEVRSLTEVLPHL